MDSSGEYRRFITANEEATRLCVPRMERSRTSLRSKHPALAAARGKVEEARLNFEREPTAELRGDLNEAKQLLFRMYDIVKGEELMERVQEAQGEQQYGEAWRVINEMR